MSEQPAEFARALPWAWDAAILKLRAVAKSVVLGKGDEMPEISRFLGMVIRMYWDEHPPPHFHVQYGEWQGQVRIDTLEVIEGKLPRRAYLLLVEWALLHRPELKSNWERIERGEPLLPVQPLD